MDQFPTADNADDLRNILNSDPGAPDDVSQEMAERLVSLAAERTQMRGDSPFEQEKDYLLTASWYNMMADKLGSHGDRANEFALGVINFSRSEEKDAWFVSDVVVPQRKWLEDGDGRMSKLEPVDLSDTEYHSKEREMWWGPKGVDYVTVIEFRDGLVKGDASVADAM